MPLGFPKAGAAAPQEAQASDAIKSILYVRHGKTNENNDQRASEDLIRSWNDIPLNDEGRAEAERSADDVLYFDPQMIVCSDLLRAAESADIMARRLHIPVHKTPLLRPWNLGQFTGQPSSEVLPKLEAYAWEPDRPIPGGEPFNVFRDRSFRGLRAAIMAARNLNLIIVAHYRNYALFKGWDDCGQPPDFKIKIHEFVKMGPDTGTIWPFDVNLRSLFGNRIQDFSIFNQQQEQQEGDSNAKE